MSNSTISSNKGKQRVNAEATDALTCSAAYIPDFDKLPDSAMVRLAQLVRDPKHPNKPVPLPFSAATLWRKVKVADGAFPKPIKLGARTTVWRVSEVRAWMAAQAQEGGAA